MSDRATAMSVEFYQTLGSQIAAVAPAGWASVAIYYAEVGHAVKPAATVQLADGERLKLSRFPMDAIEALHDLKVASYQPGAGTWFDADVLVHADGRITADFNYDNPPRATFGSDTYASDFEMFPRDPSATPAWLAEHLAAPRGWYGARWQFSLTAPGANRTSPAAIDATTTDQGHAWMLDIQARLAQAGHQVQARRDDGEDGRGNPTVYDELIVPLGTGELAVSFFRDLILWTAEVTAEDCDEATFRTAARSVLATLRAVSGYELDPAEVDADERALLGLD